ncbi:HNH endonuclease [Campylobacter fetus subsp. venerealis]|uniref:HNH endonuclease n=1 Tax=Campylobacter fetus TaxID=196 RepID=UPI0018E7F4C8|nr:HNH endonuclease [Campylobacter fetus]QQF52439.1 HNH endonuclease [Campylobacter fetus subsp. venerealis]
MNVNKIIEPLEIVRKSIGAKLIDFEINFNKINIESTIIEALETEGIEVKIDEIKILDDQTFSYHGRRVILHIRDVSEYHDNFKLPKYHVVACKTYKDMISKGRQHRYKVASRDDGKFTIVKIGNNRVEQTSQENLDVCKNCLSVIEYKISKNKFTLKRFFDIFPKDAFGDGHSSDNDSVRNLYPDKWNEISKKMKEKANYRCQQCGKNCKNDIANLHTHHINGDKSNCNPSNLKVLCAKCHSEQPYHEHMKKRFE